ncbi:hypothetical protein [Streptomyces sp. NBC_00658]
MDTPCPEPATHTVQADDNSGRHVVCDGYAMTACLQVLDGQVVPGVPA